jgi:hypothetical protein
VETARVLSKLLAVTHGIVKNHLTQWDIDYPLAFRLGPIQPLHHSDLLYTTVLFTSDRLHQKYTLLLRNYQYSPSFVKHCTSTTNPQSIREQLVQDKTLANTVIMGVGVCGGICVNTIRSWGMRSHKL